MDMPGDVVMDNFGSYFVAGLAVLLAFEYVAPAGATLAYRDVAARDMTYRDVTAPASFYAVNRAGKGDRLPVAQTTRPAAPHAQRPANADRMPHRVTDAARGRILVGCDPAFSNLSHNAPLNFATRCVS